MSDRCPHARVEFCPLYVAAHEPHGLGCIRSGAAQFECAIRTGALDYALALGRLRAVAPRMVAEIEWRAEVAKMDARNGERMRRRRLH